MSEAQQWLLLPFESKKMMAIQPRYRKLSTCVNLGTIATLQEGQLGMFTWGSELSGQDFVMQGSEKSM
jgi:hypothetical protein